MTAAPARGRANRNRGVQAERDLVRWLRTTGWPQAERAVRTGYRTSTRTTADPGDVTGTGLIVWSVKDCAVERLTDWLAELDAMEAPAGAVRLLVHKRRGHADPGSWWCWLRLPTLIDVCGGPVVETAWLPVRMELAGVVLLLRKDGHGDHLENGPQIAAAGSEHNTPPPAGSTASGPSSPAEPAIPRNRTNARTADRRSQP